MQYGFNISKFHAYFLVTCAALLLSACALSPTLTPAAYYQCERGTELQVVFKEITVSKKTGGGRNTQHRLEKKRTTAFVTLNDGTALELPVQKVASGFMFSNGRYTLRGKGNEAMWAVGRMVEEQCTLKPNS